MLTATIAGKTMANVYDDFNRFKEDYNKLKDRYFMGIWELNPSDEKFSIVVVKTEKGYVAAIGPNKDISGNKNFIRCIKREMAAKELM